MTLPLEVELFKNYNPALLSKIAQVDTIEEKRRFIWCSN